MRSFAHRSCARRTRRTAACRSDRSPDSSRGRAWREHERTRVSYRDRERWPQGRTYGNGVGAGVCSVFGTGSARPRTRMPVNRASDSRPLLSLDVAASPAANGASTSFGRVSNRGRGRRTPPRARCATCFAAGGALLWRAPTTGARRTLALPSDGGRPTRVTVAGARPGGRATAGGRASTRNAGRGRAGAGGGGGAARAE